MLYIQKAAAMSIIPASMVPAMLGARVRLVAGGRTREHYVRSASSYASQSELTARFGLEGGVPVERVEVFWPSGLKEEFPPPAPGTTSLLVEGAGRRLKE